MKINMKFITLCCAVILSACNLDEKPYGFYSEDNFYKSSADADAAVCYAYDALTYLEYSRAIFYLGDLPTEECTIKSDASADERDLDAWKVADFKTNSLLTNFFKYAYIAINRANAILKNVPGCDFDQTLKNKYLGEAYFLRAWNYFNLVRSFGLVPVHTSVVETLSETSAPMATSLDQIYDLILSDCKKAESLLTVEQALGRADQIAAQSLAAKAYLMIASAKEHNVPLYSQMKRDVAQMYDSAANFAEKVVYGQSTYGFEDNLFSMYDVDKPLGKENIFLLSMDRTGTIEGEYSKISKMFLPYVDGSPIYLDNYNGTYSETHDGWSVFQTNTDFYNNFNATDKRKTDLFVVKIYDDKSTLTGEYPGKILYPFTRKYIDPKFIGDKTSTRPFLIRFSDIALVYAEAAGPTSNGYEVINHIRHRAGLGDLAPNLTIQQFRAQILQERTWELNLEGDHLYDLRRFNQVTTVVPEAAGLSAQDATFYPIPKTETDLNLGL